MSDVLVDELFAADVIVVAAPSIGERSSKVDVRRIRSSHSARELRHIAECQLERILVAQRRAFGGELRALVDRNPRGQQWV